MWICEVSNFFFTEHLWTTASIHWKIFGTGDFQDLVVINSILFHEVMFVDQKLKDILNLSWLLECNRHWPKIKRIFFDFRGSSLLYIRDCLAALSVPDLKKVQYRKKNFSLRCIVSHETKQQTSKILRIDILLFPGSWYCF